MSKYVWIERDYDWGFYQIMIDKVDGWTRFSKIERNQADTMKIEHTWGIHIVKSGED